MEVKLGSIVDMTSDFAKKVTSNIDNTKFLVTAVTDFSISIKSLLNRNNYSVSTDYFVKNFKWTNDSLNSTNSKVKKTPKKDTTEKSDYSYMSSKSASVKGSALTSITTSDDFDPYGGGGVYG
jgi:hypothetical protein